MRNVRRPSGPRLELAERLLVAVLGEELEKCVAVSLRLSGQRPRLAGVR